MNSFMINLISKIKTSFILGVFIFFSISTYAQPKNTNFVLNKLIDRSLTFDIIYFDEDPADSYSKQFSLILNNELALNSVSVNLPLEINDIINGDIKSINDFYKFNNENLVLYVVSQSSSTRNTLKGFFYFDNKLIGSFSSYRTIWNNNRIMSLAEFVSKKIKDKMK